MLIYVYPSTRSPERDEHVVFIKIYLLILPGCLPIKLTGSRMSKNMNHNEIRAGWPTRERPYQFVLGRLAGPPSPPVPPVIASRSARMSLNTARSHPFFSAMSSMS